MSASTIFFNGRVISIPGSYSEVDASGLETVGLGAAGIIGLLGDGEGGIPVSAITEISEMIQITKPEQANQIFKSGDLREAIPMLFAPGKDPNILGGAVSVFVMKTNPATQSQVQFSNAQGPALDILSADYGAFTEQINISIASGTVQGKLLTITFEDVVEAVDDLGGDDMFSISYTAHADGWGAVTAEVLAGGIVKTNASRLAMTGLDTDILTGLAASGVVEVHSSSAADTGQIITVYGLNATGTPIKENFTLNGTTIQVGLKAFGLGKVLGAKCVGTTAGTVDVQSSPAGVAIMTLAIGVNKTKGLKLGVAMFAGSIATLFADGASTKDVILSGTNATGAQTLEKITLNGTADVDGVGVFANITEIILGEVLVATDVSLTATAAVTNPAIQNTLQKVDDYYNARQTVVSAVVYGFTLTMVTSQTRMDPANLDVTLAAVDCVDPADPGFKADLYAIIAWINQNSVLITASAATGATGGFPDNTAAPTFLVGGSEGTTSFTDYQNGLNLLKRVRVNTIVALSGDPAVHAAMDAHCAYMGGIGRSERDGVAGAMNAAVTGLPSKTEAKTQVVDLNSRHTRLVAQSIERYNTAGERTEFMTPFHACVVAGMQAGSAVGESLTYKYANVLSFKQHSSWNPTDDAEEMIQAGVMFLENVEGVGRRFVRNITTHLSTSNIAYTEASVNEAMNFAVFNFRTTLEFAVGRKGFSGQINATKGLAIGALGLLVDAETLVLWRSLQLDLLVDVMEVGVEMAPVIPINFVKSTVHLVTVAQTAA